MIPNNERCQYLMHGRDYCTKKATKYFLITSLLDIELYCRCKKHIIYKKHWNGAQIITEITKEEYIIASVMIS